MIPFAFKVKDQQQKIITRFFLVFMFIALFLALGKYSIFFRLVSIIPGYPFRIPARFLLLFVLSGSVLAARGFHVFAVLIDKEERKILKKKTILTAGFLILFFILIYFLNYKFMTAPKTEFESLYSQYSDFMLKLQPFWKSQFSYSVLIAACSIGLLAAASYISSGKWLRFYIFSAVF